MSAFTMYLYDVIKATGGTLEIVNGVSKMTGGDIGLNHYPIFEQSGQGGEPYRQILNGKIIDHYMNQEIGMETVSLFKLAMRRKMNEIMPLFNKLYLSELVAYDPLSTLDLTTVVTGNTEQETTTNTTGNSETENNSKSRSVIHDTPQTALAGNADYASGMTDVTGEGTANGTNTEEATASTTADQNVTTHVDGYQGAASSLIMEFRQSLMNLDLQVINELDDCFMQVWDNSDSYTPNQNGYYI